LNHYARWAQSPGSANPTGPEKTTNIGNDAW
jgi:hypothetical protein